MKYLVIVLSSILSIFIIVGLCSTSSTSLTAIDTSDFLRIHIRANSNEFIDQDIKYQIKDKFVEYLTPLVCECEDKNEAVNIVGKNSENLKHIADSLLKEKNFDYKTNIKICKEYFPTRTYDGYTLESGYYDSIIVELGSAEGNNWWCVIYPPLCFTNFSQNSQNIVYKSKIMEIINKFFEKEN